MEIAGADRAIIHHGRLGFRHTSAVGERAHDAGSGFSQRNVACGGDFYNIRKRCRLVQNLVHKASVSGQAIVTLPNWEHAQRQPILGGESGSGSDDIPQASEQQSATDDQDRGQSDFADNQRAAQTEQA